MSRDEGILAQISAAASPVEDAASGIGSPSPRPRYVSLQILNGPRRSHATTQKLVPVHLYPFTVASRV